MNDNTLLSTLTVGEFKTLVRDTVREELLHQNDSPASEETTNGVQPRFPDDPSAPQHVRLKMLMDALEDYQDDKSPEWWAEFDKLIEENRFKSRDVDFGDEASE